ncbi:MAG TPA: glycosyltransferase [Bacteroidales bacterium]|nr:glycosyltransferase [Bacteroidales bacterium]
MVEGRRNLLVTLADKKYLNEAKQLFSSVYWNAGWQWDYMLLSHEIPDEDLLWFKNKGILIKDCTPLFDRKTGEFDYPPVIFDKFYLFTPEFKKWQTVIFLDSDIIVKGSLDQLTKIKYFGAVQDIYFNKLYAHFFNPDKNKYLDKTYNLNVAAFNSGVFCFNTAIITPQLFSELNKLVKNHISDFRYPEQAALNLAFYGKWKKMPWIYNTYLIFHKFKLPKKIKPINLHFFATQNNPLWNPENPFYQEWVINRERSEYIDLNKIQKVKKWNPVKIWFYNLKMYVLILGTLAPDRIKKFFYIYDICSFFVHIVPYNIQSIKKTTIRFFGKIGTVVRKQYPNFYNKIRRLIK